jgi:uncharacterized protein
MMALKEFAMAQLKHDGTTCSRLGQSTVLIFLLLTLSAPLVHGFDDADAPRIKEPVTDLAGVLKPKQHAQLSSALLAMREKNGVQMAILTVASLPPQVPIEDYALAVAQRWRGGSAERDDGVLLVLAMNDRKSRLEVGYGLEGWLPDGKARKILDEMRPALRAGKTHGALKGAVTDIATALSPLKAGESKPLGGRVLGGAIWLTQWVGPALSILISFFFGFIVATAFRQRRPLLPAWSIALHRFRWWLLVLAALLPGLLYFWWQSHIAGYQGLGVALQSVVFVIYGATFGAALSMRWVQWGACIVPVPSLLMLVFIYPPIDPITATVGSLMVGLFFAVVLLGVLVGRSQGGGGVHSGGATASTSGGGSGSSAASSGSGYDGDGGSFGGGGASSGW